MNETVQMALVGFLPQISYAIPYIGILNVTRLLLAVSLFFGFIIIFKLIQNVIVKRLRILSKKTDNNFDDVIIDAIYGIRPWVYILIATYIALQAFDIPSAVAIFAKAIFLFSIVWQAIDIASKLVDYFTTHFLERDDDGDGVIDPNSANASSAVTLIARIVFWVLGVLFVLSNLGIEVTSVIAGLGIGGIAIAFALQGVLSDLFSSFSIYFDKPFRIGDYIVIGEHSGTVERIGIKTTRIRTLQGEELVVSNSELTKTRIQNFKKMQERRISFQFGITYETPHEKVKAVNGIVERIFEAQTQARLDRVHFTSFGDSALIFSVVYFVKSADYAEYLAIQQVCNFELMDRFAELGIEFAYPTQTLYLKKVDI